MNNLLSYLIGFQSEWKCYHYLELSFDYVHEADDVVDLPMGDDYYYDDYMYEVDAKPLSIPMTERPLKSIKRPTQSIKLNKQELLELYGDLTDVLDELPAMKKQSSMISHRPMPTRPPTRPPTITRPSRTRPLFNVEEDDLIKLKTIKTKGDLLELYEDLNDALDELNNREFPKTPMPIIRNPITNPSPRPMSMMRSPVTTIRPSMFGR